MKEIELTRGKVALVDDEDYQRLSLYSWSVFPSGTTFYAVSATSFYVNGVRKQKRIWMHRLIANTPEGKLTDHKDGNGLNNCKSNLRVCTAAENVRNRGLMRSNTSGYKGVSWFKPQKCWDVRISVNKKQIHLGYFKNKEEARDTYLKAAKEYHKSYARI